MVTQQTIAKRIQKRLKEEKGLDVPYKTIRDIINAEWQEYYMVIATEDKCATPLGFINGEERPPKRLSGFITTSRSSAEHQGYSTWKRGIPRFTWSRVATLCDAKDASEYFELPEHRYSSAAREYRKLTGKPEIPEFQCLSEEEIQDICKKQDDLDFSKLSKKKQSRKLRDDKYNAKKLRGSHIIWEQENYTPCGAYAENFEGKQDDALDRWFQKVWSETPDDSVQQLEVVRSAIDVATIMGVLEDHRDLFDREDELVEKVKSEGKEEQKHHKRHINHIKKIGGFWAQVLGGTDPLGRSREQENEQVHNYI